MRKYIKNKFPRNSAVKMEALMAVIKVDAPEVQKEILSNLGNLTYPKDHEPNLHDLEPNLHELHGTSHNLPINALLYPFYSIQLYQPTYTK